ncbi:uncharacterized protein LOC123477447 [Daphnia magna]|uniref:uncharacterized protein LOC123477447 n=1 Tax=Daphnia magna TaxID=35525 RepID=UPI001E1BACF8|nr:uncharacterized protein LOC123477447 [Daphnia magna]
MAANATPSAHNVYSLLVLFDFKEQPPGIASVSAIFKPTLCEDEKDVLALLTLWIESKRQVVVRWRKGDSSHWNLKLYLNNIEDSDHRLGVPVCFSDDKDFLRQKKLDLNKLAVDNLQPKEKVAIRSRRQLIYPAQPDQSSKRNHLEKENEDLKLKIWELEEQLKDSTNSTMEDCKTKVSTLEEELDQMALQLADRECEAIESEKLESLEKKSSLTIQ